MAGLELLRFLKDDEYPNLESINKDRVQREKKNQVSLFLKCAEISVQLGQLQARDQLDPTAGTRWPQAITKVQPAKEKRN